MANKYLYKYKKIETVLDLTRILDIIQKKEIYLPRYHELNDPFESHLNYIETSDAGSSILKSAGLRRDYIDSLFNKYGILSLTANCRNPVMLTMYTDYYNGICIGFEGLDNAGKIEYRKEEDGVKYIKSNEIEENEDKLIETLMVKYAVWSYEDEYRVISREKFLNVKDNIKFIIIGSRIDDKIKKILYDECKKENIEVYETYISYSSGKIIIKKYGFKYEFDGSTIEDDLKDKI